ncbi:alpha/beta hydrolase domain-containing protein [Piscinibacter gummiphilus]|uniref:Alpha/beta hydrolase domain-containing protein n=1 Tax=Piscinibacter gummiphilus TaxID=946333 RepID=A0ABZ0CV60_9BURK|nr:alpha/beta hydrolase domain-containing protein [Piscinibacter gummiphilus]WOB08860.1 alpha/beta hydrolase domain-containing protein [Piscinibacter gummiphilus]
MFTRFASRPWRGLIGAAALCAAAGATAAGTPLPSVTGPVPATATSYPFGAADHTLKPQQLWKLGYVEEEFFISGKANVYEWPAPGPAVVRTADAPYTTRALVRRPAHGHRFSGNVIVELLNPSNLFDLNIGWGLSGDHFVRQGDVWVGVTVKPVSMVSLQTFNPTRYAPLSLANPLPLDHPDNCATVAADSSRSTENGLAWDIYSQTAAWLRSQDKSNPLRRARGFKVEQVYGFGYSQTGGYLYNYINGIHPIETARNGGVPLFDGYIVAVAGGAFVGAVPINQCRAAPPLGDPRRQFNHVGVPIIHVMSQSDYLIGIAARRPDSDVQTDRYRHYEMAGAGHATPDELYSAAAPADIAAAGRAVPPLACNEGPRSRFPSGIHFNAIFQNLDLWVRRGIAPPHSEPILVENGQPVLDQFGNVQGGLRSPFVDVPTARWNGSSTGASFCFIAGHEVPFEAALLQQLYRNDLDYDLRVAANVKRLLRERFLTRADASKLVVDAVRLDIP